MFKNHLKIAFRNIRKHKGFAFITVTGLAVGIGCCLMILLYIQDELSFDSFHSKKDRIYRVDKTVLEEGGQIVHTAEMPGNFAPTLVQDYPEVESAVRLRPWWDAMLISRSEKRLKIANVIITDSTFFEIFDFALLRGDPHKALAEPLSVVITEEVARQFFGDADPMGQVLEGLYDMPLKITGIAKAAPTHSHIRFDVLISWSTSTNSAYADRFDWMNRWITQAVFTYILLAPEASPTALEAKFPAFMKTYMARWADKYFPYLQPLGDIHLRSTGIQFQHNHNAGNILLIYVFAVTAVLILAIACINFMNLTTARATRRAKEVGMRKVVGAEKKHLIRQFLSESMLFAMLALAIAIVIIEFALPFFNELTQRQLGFSLTNNPLLFAGMFFITLLAGIAAGSYPAFVLSAFRPVEVFKGSQGSTLRGVFSRKILVIAQFFFAIILIVAAAVVYRQMDYMQSKDLGFKKDQVIIIPFDGSSLRSQAHSFKNAVLQNLDVLSAALTSGGPGLGATGFDMLPEGWAISERHGVPTIGVDFDFIDTYKLRIAKGRGFDLNFPTDSAATVINETLAKQIGWKNPIGKKIALGTDYPDDLHVIGVVEDFHLRSVQQHIEPVLMYITSSRLNNLAVKLSGRNIAETLQSIGETWKKFESKYPFEYTFLDDTFARYYRSERQLMQILGIFSTLAIVIACLGLFGLASFMTEQRTKEIGVRKVLGASVANVTALLSKDFVKLVLLANLIAWPVAWFAMNKWLQNFAYRIEISWWVFALAGGLALVIALLTVSTQAIRAALANPVESLRYE